jgi:hypothetical protein
MDLLLIARSAYGTHVPHPRTDIPGLMFCIRAPTIWFARIVPKMVLDQSTNTLGAF